MAHRDNDKVPLTFTDGAALLKNYIYLAAKYDSLDPEVYADISLGVLYEAGEWYRHADMMFDVVSVCSYKLAGQSGICVALSRHGDLHFINDEGEWNEQISGAGYREKGGLGPMSQVRQAGDSLFACGARGQVYRRIGREWTSISETIIDRRKDQPLWLNAIGGSAEDDLFVAGYHGRILHFDGEDWTELDSPTNLHLERICSVGRGQAYVCGNEGTLLRIANGGIEDMSIDTDQHFWGLTFFKGHLYAATLSKIYVLEDDDLYELDTGLGPDVEFYRLDNRDGMLWSFAAKDLVRFDGKRWKRLPFPDNED